MPGSFENQKILRFVVTLSTGKFGSSQANQIALEGYRAAADVEKAGGVQNTSLRAKVYGVSQSDMNSTVTLQWKIRSLIPNTVEVYAIDGSQETKVFAGNIINSWGMYQGQPDVYLMIQAQGAYFHQLKPVPPRSFAGTVDVASVMAQIARDMGMAFENNGVQAKLSNPYLANTNLEQAKELAHAAGVDLYVDDDTLAICPRGIPRKGLIPLISKDTGLIGYPTFDGVGVNFETLFNPGVVFGGRINLSTDLEQANGEWVVTSVSHRLESVRPGGAWFSRIRGNKSGLAVIR